MSSADSDDEPLSVLASCKQLNPEKFCTPELEVTVVRKKKKKKKNVVLHKAGAVTIQLRTPRRMPTPPIIQRPTDVWLYLKDLNPTGPYSCLLCPDWFISRPKIVIHYILNHKKDFCGICRYFVPNRESWIEHEKFHSPWPCSQCIENFEKEVDLRDHLSNVHNLVHCTLCHFCVPDDDQYNIHLLSKHNVTNVGSKNEPMPWDPEYDGGTDFLCLLCSKSINFSTFVSHYMGHHHYTIKCLSKILSGADLPFVIVGANLSSQFIAGQLQNHKRFGYLDIDEKVAIEPCDNNASTTELYDALIPEIKQENLSDTEESKIEVQLEPKNEKVIDYTGEDDFDITLMELIIPEKSYYEYVKHLLEDIKENTMPLVSDINYGPTRDKCFVNFMCGFCKTKHFTINDFVVHMFKMHSVKCGQVYSCRICATSFDNQVDLESHSNEELGEFEDLWLCQFCEKEFDNRQKTRHHLTEHWDILEYDNCFSPHLGFKCKHCPMLFWNETDRQVHEVRVHINKYRDQYYWCDTCDERFSDKVWFCHHYFDKHFTEGSVPGYLLKCHICCIIKTNVEDMRAHFQENHPDAKKVFCHLDACKFRPLRNQKSMKVHLKSQHDPVTMKLRPATCQLCNREFATTRACGAHMAQKHGPGRFKCKLCGETLTTMDERKLHYLIVHPGQHPYQCGECGKSFQYKSTLYMHRKEHVAIKESYPCTYCGKVFMKRDSFREHVAIHEGPRHACSYCPMRFVQRSNMLRHERRHTGERPYACAHCPRTFADKGACTSHTRTHVRDKTYSCMYCGQTFVQKSKLTYHIRKHTGENLETCTVCAKIFTSGCSLREHMKTHILKKDAVKCPLCDKRYGDERYMLRHLRTSHAHPTFKCPLCPKLVTSSSSLKDHVFTHSRTKSFRCNLCPKGYNSKRTIVKHLRRRHSLKGDALKANYRRLDPRECQLAISDEVMQRIFGTFKMPFNPGEFNQPLVEDNVKDDDNKVVPTNENVPVTDEGDSQSRAVKSDKDSDTEVKIKTEREDEEDELEPTDFVSVKIEPMDYDDD